MVAVSVMTPKPPTLSPSDENVNEKLPEILVNLRGEPCDETRNELMRRGELLTIT
jgi:hypothetical protein